MAMGSEFLKQAWFIENEEQEYIKTVKGSKGGPGSAVSPYPTFNPSSDVEALHKAITVRGNSVFPKQSPPRHFRMATEKQTCAMERVCFVLKIQGLYQSHF